MFSWREGRGVRFDQNVEVSDGADGVNRREEPIFGVLGGQRGQTCASVRMREFLLGLKFELDVVIMSCP